MISYDECMWHPLFMVVCGTLSCWWYVAPFVSDDIDSRNPSTPSHFLIGRSSSLQPPEGRDVSGIIVAPQLLRDDDVARKNQLERFWSIWSSEYLRNLPPVVRGFNKRGNITVGSVVLIREDNCPRLQWPIARITKAFIGKDGIARSFEVKTATGNVRPIKRLHNLEIVEHIDQSEVDTDVVPQIPTIEQVVESVNVTVNNGS